MAGKLPKGRIIEKTSVLIRVAGRHDNRVYYTIQDSNKKIGKYGNYDCVFSKWPVFGEKYMCFWTFCSERDEEEVGDILRTKIPARIDFIPSRVFMLHGHEPEVENAKQLENRTEYLAVDIPHGNWEDELELIKKVGAKVTPYKNDTFKVLPALGNYRALSGSHPQRGEEMKLVRDVHYRKYLLPVTSDQEKQIVNDIRREQDYELPVFVFFENMFKLSDYLSGAEPELKSKKFAVGD